MSEKEVFEQEISEEELEDVAGGSTLRKFRSRKLDRSVSYKCTIAERRNIYDGGFPNCAQSVEDGSFCFDNDACFSSAVKYVQMNSCTKAWQ